MAITLHFIDKNGFIGEHFFHAVHIKDIMTDSKTKKCAMFYLVMIFLQDTIEVEVKDTMVQEIYEMQQNTSTNPSNMYDHSSVGGQSQKKEKRNI